MTHTASETSTQVTSQPDGGPDDRIGEMVRNAKAILRQVDAALVEIEHAAMDIDDYMDELSALEGFPKDAEDDVERLRGLDLTSDLGDSVRALRSEIAADAAE